MINVVVMCAGAQERLAGVLDRPKQLLELEVGETILGRTVRLVRELASGRVRVCSNWTAPLFEGGSPFMSQLEQVSSDCEVAWAIVEKMAAIDTEWHRPAPGEAPTLIDNMRAARFDYGETLFLLGDVVWSREGLRHVLEHIPEPGAPAFYQRSGVNRATGKDWGETFAFRCEHDCELAPAVNLWGLARAFAHHCERVPMPEGDWTDDIDTPDELERFFPALCVLARNDVP